VHGRGVCAVDELTFEAAAELLQVSPSASQEVVDAAWRRLSRNAHPDAGGDEERFKELERAHALMSDPGARLDYKRSFERERNQRAPAPTSADTASVVAEPWTPPSSPVWPRPRRRRWLSLYTAYENWAVRVLTDALAAAGLVWAAACGAALGFLGSGLVRLPSPTTEVRLAVVGGAALLALAAPLAILAGSRLHRPRSTTAFRWMVRLYSAAIAAFAVLTLWRAVAAWVVPLVIVGIAVLVVRARRRRGPGGSAS